MTAPNNEPGGVGRDADPTASGLDESQIDSADLQALHDIVRLHTIALGTAVQARRLENWECSLPPGSIRAIEPGCAAPRRVTLRLAPLPHKVAIRRLPQPTSSIRIKRDTPLAQRQPVRRRKLRPDDLPEAQLKTLFTKVYEKYGELARGMEIAAVFPHIPPEAANAISVDPALAWAAFVLPPAVAPDKARAGFYLIVLTAPNETRKVLFRL